MNQIISKVLFIKVGVIKTFKLENQKRDEYTSAIKKYPVDKSFLTKTGFIDDSQADLLHHGGLNKALFLFSKKSYEKINKEFNNIFDIKNMAYFGENIILDKICEDDICVGDILKIGEAKVQITQARQPCYKLSLNTNQKNMTDFIFKSGLTGFYAKVLNEGEITVNDDVILESRVCENLTIAKLNQIILNPKIDEDLTLYALNSPFLGLAFKNSLQKRYELGDKDEQFLSYHT